MERKHLTRDAVRELLCIMFEGWRIRESSWVAGDPVDEYESMILAAGGDRNLGTLCKLFDEWSNDIVSMAAFYGVGWLKDGTFSSDLPPPPSDEHWWSDGEWKPPFEKAPGKDIESD